MKFVLIFLCSLIATFAFAQDDEQEWKKFKLTHRKSFSSPQRELVRKRTFLNSKKLVEEHNKRFNEKKELFSLKLNQHSDIPFDELCKMRNGRRPDLAKKQLKLSKNLKRPRNPRKPKGPRNPKRPGKPRKPRKPVKPKNPTQKPTVKPATNLPDSFDWRTKGVLTPVKDQGECGSCYSFSTTEHLESLSKIKNGTLPLLSQQQIVDCSTTCGNMGCNGGLESYVFDYTRAKGSQSSSSYPYGGTKQTCKYNPANVILRITGYKEVDSPTTDQLKELVLTAPMPVGMCASMNTFMHYSGGIYADKSCPSDPNKLDHAVLLCGWGSENGVNYWIVRNSWGTGWGEAGYFRIAIAGNLCGIQDSTTYAIL